MAIRIWSRQERHKSGSVVKSDFCVLLRRVTLHMEDTGVFMGGRATLRMRYAYFSVSAETMYLGNLFKRCDCAGHADTRARIPKCWIQWRFRFQVTPRLCYHSHPRRIDCKSSKPESPCGNFRRLYNALLYLLCARQLSRAQSHNITHTFAGTCDDFRASDTGDGDFLKSPRRTPPLFCVRYR